MTLDMTCIFCRIIAGEIPSAKVYEDDQAFAFLDIGPLSEGHLLVIPKTHVAHLVDMTSEQAAAVGRVVPTLGKALLSVTGADGLNMLVNNGKSAGQEVMHVHWHLIPRVAGDGLGYRWSAGSYPEGRLDELAEAYRSALDPD
ncbi:MAG: HIT family protein [Phycisphaerae bacterium]